MILRFAADLTVPFSNNQAERTRDRSRSSSGPPAAAGEPSKASPASPIVQSCLSTATKWGLDKLDVLRQLLTTGPWLPRLAPD
jgi:transposase